MKILWAASSAAKKLTILNCFHESRVARKVINLKEQQNKNYLSPQTLRENFLIPVSLYFASTSFVNFFFVQ